MSDTALRGVVVCHGPLAEAMIAAAEHISGVTGALTPVSNSGCDRASIERRVAEAVGQGPAIVFVDMPSGSCMFAAMQTLKAIAGVKVVTGVNLAMLVDFIFHRDLPAAEAAERAVRAGAAAIKVP
jgi:mannose/fructose-specific phosphotransferase system component IIA